MRRMITKIAKKFHRQNGETLPEVLASILICTLSVAMLFTGVMASVRINEQAAQADKGFYETLSAAEQKDGDILKKSQFQVVEVSGSKGGVVYNVNFYGSDKLKSYRYTGVANKSGGLTP